MILTNLLPEIGKIQFKARFELARNDLTIMFFDPQTWCQTHDFQLHFENNKDATRWLYMSLLADLAVHDIREFTRGNEIFGFLTGSNFLEITLGLGQEVILTPGIVSPWFTGASAPFSSRRYPMSVWLTKRPIPRLKTRISSLLGKVLESSKFPKQNYVEEKLLIAECLMLNGNRAAMTLARKTLDDLFTFHVKADDLVEIDFLNELQIVFKNQSTSQETLPF